ncbi:MAG: bifunctional 5,10-methylenetetrahydrofolate dehydrogenase/5,10-methenyltetrahydrofolate cyclohydrolase [Candidatus Omnitrophota bacterium]|nr:bifunctional 5,10-methylenetetrahydrofolate dehydrogenase/5,10-methenyltetrahydrofolate cyclohydrolase [Candidatus Omnitrophota bacterium]
MSAIILDGRAMARSLKDGLRQEIEKLKRKYRTIPRLAVIQIGQSPDLVIYLRSQERTAQTLGIEHRVYKLKPNIKEKKVIELIKDLNENRQINGIMIQRPFPAHLNWQEISRFITPQKNTEMISPTVLAIIELIEAAKVDLKGKEAVIIGRSDIIGRPLAMCLLDRRVTVTICHTATRDMLFHTKRAEILVAAAGKPRLIKPAMVKKGAIVIDVGINKVDGKIMGDVEFEGVVKKAGFISPVPGGVGPLTVVMLMRNVVNAFKSQRTKK